MGTVIVVVVERVDLRVWREDGARFGFESYRFFFLVPFLFLRGGGGDGSGMNLSKVGEKILSSARSLGLLPPPVDRPEYDDKF
ncbi:hypothetical protein SADUNF_Sadunf09G0001200 [Salix dunnii]|uniref:Uncharacterized protein n=1 Tax=Salix dunnii TaxID=1413687 RepID=A0A835MRM5_9ROSI|nr:hypothetical protein SADUNF_Sadunf09G0001200 [Salix dunnii]